MQHQAMTYNSLQRHAQARAATEDAAQPHTTGLQCAAARGSIPRTATIGAGGARARATATTTNA
eukprot:10606988-Lingulodinium_polyedra.AAC.1